MTTQQSVLTSTQWMMAAAIDNCNTVVVTVEEATAAGACAGDYVITRTFTATDACGKRN